MSMNLSNLYTLVCQGEFQSDCLRNHNESGELHIGFAFFEHSHILTLLANLVGKLLLSNSCGFTGVFQHLGIVPGTRLRIELITRSSTFAPYSSTNISSVVGRCLSLLMSIFGLIAVNCLKFVLLFVSPFYSPLWTSS